MDDVPKPPPDERLLTLAQVRELIPLSASSLYRMMESQTFPPRVRVGRNRVAWRYTDIKAWIAERNDNAMELTSTKLAKEKLK